MASKVYKQHELTINVSPRSRRNIITDTTFFSMDVETGKKRINFMLGDRRLNLTDATVMLGFEFVGTGMSKIIDSTDGSVVIENARRGQCSVVLPNHLYQYSGQVLVHAYIMFDDGRSFDAGVIVTEFKESWLDSELEEMSDFYVKRFEDLAREIRGRADELQRMLNDIEQALVDTGIVSELQDHIVDQDIHIKKAERESWNDRVMHNEMDEAFEAYDQKLFESATLLHHTETNTTIENTREGKLSNRSFEGRTLVNLWSDDRADFRTLNTVVALSGNIVMCNATNDAAHQHFRLRGTMFKPSTTYTFLVDFDERSDESIRVAILALLDNDIFNINKGLTTLGRHIFTATTIGAFTNEARITSSFINPNGLQNYQASIRISIFEGDLTHLELDHTPPRNLLSVGDGVDELKVTTVGENLFDGELELGGINTSGNSTPSSNVIRSVNYTPVRGGEVLRVWNSRNYTPILFEYDRNKSFIRQVPSHETLSAAGLRLRDSTRYIRLRSHANGLENNLDTEYTLTYNQPVTQPIPHQSTSTLIEYQDADGAWKKPTLQGIYNGAELLVADEVTETEYIQRVVEVDLSTMMDTSNWWSEAFEDTWRMGWRVDEIRGGETEVISNKLPTTRAHTNNIGASIGLFDGRIALIVRLQRGFTSETIPANIRRDARQYLIDNNYRFLAPLAEPRRYPIRMQSLSSFSPVTNVTMQSGAVQPRFNFKIVQSLSERITVAEGNIRILQQLVMGLLKNKEDEIVSENNHQESSSDC